MTGSVASGHETVTGARLTGPRLKPRSGGPATSVVVMLHGLGADGDDLIDLGRHWGDLLPDTAFIAPHAPFPCDMAPYGRQWFSLLDRSPSKIAAGVKATAPILNAYLDSVLAEQRLPASRMVLVGFSQGTMMSLYVAPRRTAALGGVVGYSGALVGADTIMTDVTSRPPVLLVHGDADPIVPVGASRAAEQVLTAQGFDVRLMVRPDLPHSIDPEGLVEGGRFIHRVLAAT